MATRTQKNKSNSSKKIVIAALGVLLIIVISGISAAAYAGFVPGLTEVMQTNKPVDLGIRYSAADFQQIQTSTNHLALNVGDFNSSNKNIPSVTPGENMIIYGANTTQFDLSQTELTAFLNMVPWTGSPIKNSQVRLSDNNILELSGNINAAYVSDLVKTLYPKNDYEHVSFVAKFAGRLDKPAVYAKLQISSDTAGDPNHGNLHLKILALKVNRTDLSQDVNAMNEINIKTGHGSYTQGVPYSLASLSISGGKLHYYGNAPANFVVGDGNPNQICSSYHGGSLLSLSPKNHRIGTIPVHCK